MTEEVAGMPQATLREVVLRLIQPESPPPITASDEVSLREQQGTAFLRPPAALRLSRSSEAIDFLNRFNAQAPLLDELASIFLDVAETPSPVAHLLNPYIAGDLVFEEVLYAYRIVMLGASPATMERLMVQLVRGGWWREAEQLSAKLGRELTRDEVLALVRTYSEGAVSSRESDQMWPAFAERHIGPEGARLARQWIDERNERWANDLY